MTSAMGAASVAPQLHPAEDLQRECTDTPPRWLKPFVLIAVFAWPVMAIVSGIYGRVF